MASEAKNTKAAPEAKAATVPKKEASPADKSTADAAPAKTEGSETASAAPKGYSRGEGQKPVTQAYKDNWNAIFAKKKKKR